MMQKTLAGPVLGPNAGAPGLVRPLLNGIDRLSRIDGWVAGICLITLTILILTQIMLRILSSAFPAVPSDIRVAWEYSSYLMAATFTFGAAMTLRAGGHIRVNLLLSRLSPGPRRIAELVCAALGLALTGMLTMSMVLFTYGSFERGQMSISSDTPMWIPQAVVTFGISLFALQFLARLIQVALGLPLEDTSMKAAAPAE